MIEQYKIEFGKLPRFLHVNPQTWDAISEFLEHNPTLGCSAEPKKLCFVPVEISGFPEENKVVPSDFSLEEAGVIMEGLDQQDKAEADEDPIEAR